LRERESSSAKCGQTSEGEVMDRFRGGLISGAVGTLALELATYVDMVV
jgi:hypothetical protein